MLGGNGINPGNWPMKDTFLYATFGANSGDPITTNWFDHGSVLNELKFDWSSQTNHLWAPDIQVFDNTIWLYVPDQDKNGTFRVGMAHATISNGLYADTGFDVEKSTYLTVNPAPGGSSSPNNGWMFDPGVFAVAPDPGWVVYGDTAFSSYNTGNNMSIAKLYADHKTAMYYGKIVMNWSDPLKDYTKLKYYIEGPDIFALQIPGANARTYYYLVWASSVEGATDDTGYIGYAMCTPEDFATMPTQCWKFKGWIFRNSHTGRSNHASLVQFKGKNYVFFHKAPAVCCSPENSRARQVSALQFQLTDDLSGADDGEIVGVTHPVLGDNIEDPTLYGGLDVLAPDFAPGYITVRDEDDGKNSDRIDLYGIQNVTNTTLHNGSQTFFYYLDVEPGANLRIDPVPSVSDLRLHSPPLKHISQNTWAVLIDYVGPDVAPGQTSGHGHIQIPMHYDSGTFNKLNDFSRALGNYNTRTNRIALFGTTGNVLAGRVPDTSGNTDLFKFLRTQHMDASSQFTYLKASFPQADVGINNQYLATGQTLEQWYVEPIPAADWANVQGLPATFTAADKANSFRLRNKGTNNLYMTANDVNHGTFSKPSFYVLSQARRSNPNWATQIWVKNPVGDGSFRFRSAWIPAADKNSASVDIFLTMDQNLSDTGTQNVYVQVKNDTLDRQHWLIE
jgi:hypothetical protein